jgi:membrane-associated protein
MLPFDLLPLIEFVGYPGVTLIIFLESGTIIGFWLPGASLLFTSGLLASQGFFNPWILIPLVTIAAVLGDNVGYWFGAKIGIKLFLRPDSRFFHKGHLAKTQHFYEKHGSKTILLARFIPIVRTFAPIVAGIAHMHYPTFVTYNILGALLWATGITTLGFALGSRFPLVGEYIEFVIAAIICITLIPLAWEFWKAHRDRSIIN